MLRIVITFEFVGIVVDCDAPILIYVFLFILMFKSIFVIYDEFCLLYCSFVFSFLKTGTFSTEALSVHQLWKIFYIRHFLICRNQTLCHICTHTNITPNA